MFIKVGQHLGAMDYLLPSEYVKAFKVLHSTAPEMPFSQLSVVIKEDLGRSVEELFDSVEGRPLGAASLAQCHRARLRDGREVAVKVQFPDVRRNAETDLKSMEVRANALCFNRIYVSVSLYIFSLSVQLHTLFTGLGPFQFVLYHLYFTANRKIEFEVYTYFVSFETEVTVHEAD